MLAKRNRCSHKALYNSWTRWSDKRGFSRMFARLAPEHGEAKPVIIDVAHLEAGLTATSMCLEKGHCRLNGRIKSDMNATMHPSSHIHQRRLDLFVTADQVSVRARFAQLFAKRILAARRSRDQRQLVQISLESRSDAHFQSQAKTASG